MGTKNRPGKFDCYANAEPDEPVFVLLGRDPMASALVEFWATTRELRGEDPEKVAEARACADAMAAWAREKGKRPLQDKHLLAALVERVGVLASAPCEVLTAHPDGSQVMCGEPAHDRTQGFPLCPQHVEDYKKEGVYE